MPDKKKIPQDLVDDIKGDNPTDATISPLSDAIGEKESSGKYDSVNTNSSAVGKHQFLWDTWGDQIKEVTGVKSKEDFKNNPVAQEKFFNYYEQNSMNPAVDRLKKYNKAGYSDEQLKKLYHFKGEAGAQEWLSSKTDNTSAHNSSIDDYVGAADKEKKKIPQDILDDINSDQPTPQKKNSVTGLAANSPAPQNGLSQPPEATQLDPITHLPVDNSSTTQIQPRPHPQTQLPVAASPYNAEKQKTDAATTYLTTELANRAGSFPSYADNIKNTPFTDPNSVMHKVADPHGDPAFTGGVTQSIIGDINRERKQKLDQAQQDFIGGDPNTSQQTISDIDKQYDKKIEEVKDATNHVVGLQLFNKEYTQKPLTDAAANTKIETLNKQREDNIKNANTQMRESLQGENKADIDKADEQRKDRIKQINQQTDDRINQVQSQKKWDAVRLGIEQKRLTGDKQAEIDAKAYDNGGNISPAARVQYQISGNEIKKTGMNNAAANGQDQVVSETEDKIQSPLQIERDNQSYYNTVRANKIGNAKYEDENPLFRAIVPHFGAMSQDDVEKYGKKVGLTDAQIAKIDPEQVPTSSTVWQQFAKGAFNTPADIYERMVGRPLMKATGATPEEIDSRFAPGWQNERGIGATIAGNMPTDQNSFKNVRGAIGQMFEGAGGLSTFMGEVGSTAKALELAGVAKTAESAQHMANFGVMAFNGYNSAYNESADLIGDKPKDEWKRQAYAITSGIIEGKIFSMIPGASPTELGERALGTEKGNRLLEEIRNAKSIEDLQTPDFKEAVAHKIMAVGAENGQQVGLATANTAAQAIIKSIVAPDKKQNIGEDLKNTAISTSLAMMIPSILSGTLHGNMQSPLAKAAMFEVGTNSKPYIDNTAKLLADGKIIPEQAQATHDAIITMGNVVKHTPTANAEGKQLTPDQVKDYAWNLLQENTLQKRADKVKEDAEALSLTPDKAQLDPINKKITEATKNREEILKNAGAPRPVTPSNPKETTQDIANEMAKEHFDLEKNKKGELNEPDQEQNDHIKNNPEQHINFNLNYYKDLLESGGYAAFAKVKIKKYQKLKDRFDVAKANKAPNVQGSVATDAQSAIDNYVTKLQKQYKEFSSQEGENKEDYDKHIALIKSDPEYAINHELTYYKTELESELNEKYKPAIQEHIDELEAIQKKIFENKKEDISLTPQSKTNDHGNGNENGERKGQDGTRNGQTEEQRSDTEIRGDKENGRLQGQEESLAVKPEENEKAGEQKSPALPVSGKERRKRMKLVADEEPIPLKKRDDFAAMDHGTHEGDDADKVKAITEAAADDEKIGNGESFNDFKDRIKKAWENTKKTAKDKAALITHSSVMRLIDAAEKHGWDDTKALREAYDKTAEPKIGEEHTYKTENGDIRVMRHGESEDGKANLDRTKETPLTDKGEKQAKEVIAEKLKEEIPSEIITDTQPRTSNTAEIVHEEVSGQKKEFNPPQPPRPLHDLIGDELEAYHKVLKQYNKDFEQSILGDKYKEFKNNQRIADNPSGLHSDAVEKEASRKVEEIFNSLSKDDQNALDGVTDLEIDPDRINDTEDVTPTRRAVQIVEGAQDENELGGDIGGYLIDLNDAPGEYSKMNWRQKIAFAAMKAARRVIQERGWDGNKVTTRALAHAASKFHDKQDAEFMLSKYIEFFKNKPAHPSPKENKKIEQPKEIQNPARSVATNESKEQPTLPQKKKRNQSKKGWSLSEQLQRKERVSKEEPASMEEHILQNMLAMDDKRPENKWALSSLEKEIPKGAKEKAVVKQFASDHPKSIPIDVWASDIARTEGEKHGNLPFVIPEESEIRNMIIENVSKFPTKTSLLEHLEDLQKARKEQAASVDREGQLKYEEEANRPPSEHELAQMYAGKDGEDFEGYDDEGHPIYKVISERYDDVDKTRLSEADEEKIRDFYAKYYDDASGRVDYDKAHSDHNAINSLKDELSAAGKELVDDVVPFNNFEEHSEAIQKLITDATEYSRQQREETRTAKETAAGREGTPKGGNTSRISESETPEETTGEDRLKEIDEELLKQHASQKISANKRAIAEQAKDVAEANRHNDNFYKKQDRIDKLEEEKSSIQKKLDRQDRETNIQKVYNDYADRLEQRYNDNKKRHEGEALSSILGISTKIGDHVADFLVARAIEGIRELGNIHVAIDRAIRLAKEKFGTDAKELSRDDNKAIKDHLLSLGQKSRILKDEPILPIDHEEYAKDILADIKSGSITYEEAAKEINDSVIENREGKPLSDHVQENNKAKILEYIDYHIQHDLTSIKNDTTRLRRQQLGLNEEIPAAKKEFGQTWNEAKEKIENNPQSAQNLIEELSHKARPLTDVENAILLHHQNTKEIEILKLNDNINKAAEKGDRESVLENKVAKSRVLDELQQIYDINKAVGTENARGLASRRMMVDRKYSLVNMLSEKRATANDGAKLSEEQTAEIEKLHEKITKTQQAFDDYVKQSESQIIYMQRKALSGKLTSKKTTSDKLRAFADKIEQASKNQAYSSPIPITPKMVAEAIRLVAEGIDKGGELLDLVKKAVGKLSTDNPGIDELQAEKEINKHLIDSGILEPSKEKRQASDMGGLFTGGKLDREALRLKTEADRAKAEYDIKIKKDKEQELSPMAKAQNTFVKWQRAFKLSNPLTMGKLMMAGLTRLTTTPLEDIVGGAYSAVLPQLAKGAIGEGGGLNISETASAYKRGLVLGMRDASEIMSKKSHGKSELDVLFGEAGELPPEAIDFFGQLHSATKAPIKRAIFERSLERRLRRNMANGVDITDPMVQTSIMMDAYKDANRAIFMQDNKVAEGWQKLIKHFDQADRKTGKNPTKLIGSALQWMVPFVKVPTNIAAEIGTHVYGVPVAAAKLVHAAFTKGIENIPDDQKEIILRNLKKGSLGIAALALGYFNPQTFGGFYQPGQKRKEDDAEAMGLKLFGEKVPAWLVEAPIFQAMQIGATVRRVKDEKVKGEEKGIGEGLWAGASGLVQDIPLASQPVRIAQLFGKQSERQYYLGELAKSTVDPAILTYLAKVTDPADQGNPIRKMLAPENKRKSPKTIMEHIKSGLPFLREELEEKNAEGGMNIEEIKNRMHNY